MNDKRADKPHRSFGPIDFLWRWLGSLAIVFATFNPSGHSYYHWAKTAFTGEGLAPEHYFVGVLLLAGWTVLVVATQNSMGMFGTVVSAALIGTGIWLLVDIGLVKAESGTAITWLALIALATLLAVGLSWSHIWRRLSGQLEVDDD